MRVNYSQSFGCSFVGGGANYGVNRLGSQNIPADATDVPEPLSIAMLGTGLVGLGLFRRRVAA